MNALIATAARHPHPSTSARRDNVVALPVRHLHRDREFGVGYGNSSGYASERRYAAPWAPPLFRCA